MPDIFQDFPIQAPRPAVFRAISTPAGLNVWWSQTSRGEPAEGSRYELGFGPGYNWEAKVTRCVPDREFELELTRSDDDWKGTRVGFTLSEKNDKTLVRFHHTGWPEGNEHYRVSCHCWAMYLRHLRRFLEHGEVVPYEDRLDA